MTKKKRTPREPGVHPLSRRKPDDPTANQKLKSAVKFKRVNRFFRDYTPEMWENFCDNANQLTILRFLELIHKEQGPEWDYRRQILSDTLREISS